MDLTKIMAISGRPGLYKMLTQTKNGLVVESIVDGKRHTAFSHEKISSLEEISVYTDEEDLPLRDVLKAIFEKLEGKAALSHKSDNEKLKAFFEEAVPAYDKERVYVSDIKKIVHWYNLLQEHNLLDFTEEEQDARGGEEASEQEKPTGAEKEESVEE
ncbi:MAG: DUF5606 domain-containing protein [Bacteroidales bacterium]|nr:DUF5606 domain-containing protein [Bacteroidales bacterium]